jgi:hypothetical protein
VALTGGAEFDTLELVLDEVVDEFIKFGPLTDGLPVPILKRPEVPPGGSGTGPAAAAAADPPAAAMADAAIPAAGAQHAGTLHPPPQMVGTLQHRIFLGSVAADSPAMEKLTLKVGHGAKRGCLFCGVEGEWSHEQHCVFMAGYSDKRPAPVWARKCASIPGHEQFPETFVHPLQPPPAEGGVRFTGEQQYARMHAAAVLQEQIDQLDPRSKPAVTQANRLREQQRQLGVRGLTPLLKLHYFNPSTHVLVPIMHAALYGIVKAFLGLVLPSKEAVRKHAALGKASFVIGKEARVLMMERAKHFVYPHDINRPYRCVVENRGHWTMEEYLHFVLFASVYIFHTRGGAHDDIFPDPRLRQAWDLLRTALLHYLRLPASGSYTMERRVHARECLIKFGELAGEIFGMGFCTFNMHLLACQLFHQESVHGCVVHDIELWIERMVQQVKSYVHQRTPQQPESLMARMVLESAKLAHVSLECPSLEELQAPLKRPMSAAQRALYDCGDGRTKCQLLCAGTPLHRLSQPEQDRVRAAMASFARYNTQREDIPAWARTGSLDGLSAVVFSTACRKGLEIVLSRSYSRTVTRSSCHAKVVYDENDGRGEITYVADIHCYLLLTNAQGEKVRFAITDLYTVTDCMPRQPGQLYRLRNADRPRYAQYAVPFVDLREKLILCDDKPAGRRYFLAYDVLSQQPCDDGVRHA